MELTIEQWTSLERAQVKRAAEIQSLDESLQLKYNRFINSSLYPIVNEELPLILKI